MDERPILIIDAMNMFVRCWAAYPTMSGHGYQMGGCIGFLKTLSRIMHELQPIAVYIAWEGGGSSKRRSVFKEYKLNRRPEKLNRFYEDDIPDTEENRKHQTLTLLEMLKCAPVCQLYASDCEGDDVVAYLCKVTFRDKNKIIVSSDKDLYQLLDDRTNIYSLHKKRVLTKKDIEDEFRITSKNFAIAKAICGDAGDNVPGVKGIGFKKVVKLFPMLGLDEDIILQDVFSYCHTHADESKSYRLILENEENVKRNWRLVYLDGTMVPSNQALRIDHSVGTFKPKHNKIELVRLLVREGIGDFDVDDFFYSFSCTDSKGGK